MYQHQRSSDPYVDLGGEVRVDQMSYGTSLDASDYNAAALNSYIGTVSVNNTLEWKSLDVTSSVQDDINNSRVRSQFRLYFPTEQDGESDSDRAYFYTSNNATSKPELVIVYTPGSSIPTLSEWGFIILMLVLATVTVLMIRRREA